MSGQGEHGRLEWRGVKIQTARSQLAAIAVVDDVSQAILEVPPAAIEIRERQPNVTLTLIGSEVHGHEQAAAGSLPGEGQETVPGPVPVPGWCAFEQLPLALAHDWLPERGE